MGVIVLCAVFLAVWTAAVARVVERRTERRLLDQQQEFTHRLDGLEAAVNEGLAIAVTESATQPERPARASRQRLARHSVELLSQADFIVLCIAPGKGYAVAAKAGCC